MARPLRIQYENACYHVTCRGNGRQHIFVAEYDRRKFLDLLVRSVEIYQVHLLAFVLMVNHFHLIVKTPRANLQEFMRHFNISYTAYFNKRHGRSGHLYQGRYKAFLIDADSYLLEVSRYLHLNPVHTTQLVNSDEEQKKEYLRSYQWSSYPDYISSSHYPFLSLNEVLGYFKGDRTAYRDFVEGGIPLIEKPLEKGKGHGIVGNGAFIRDMLKQATIKPSREQPAGRRAISQVKPERVLRAVTKRFRTTREEILRKKYRGPARSIAMELLYRHAGMNQREIGELMGVDYSSVSVARKRFRDMLAADDSLKKQFHAVEGALRRIKI
jgi:REP element-mobilizing transposase RayT